MINMSLLNNKLKHLMMYKAINNFPHHLLFTTSKTSVKSLHTLSNLTPMVPNRLHLKMLKDH